MPSIFSRARTTSTPKKSALDSAYDEFGRVVSRGSAKGVKASPASTKKDRKKDAKDKSRARTISSPVEPDGELTLPDGSFLPLNLDPPRYDPGEEPQEHRNQLDYGYLSYQRHVVLGLEEVARLVDVVGEELGTRGLTTPFIFSTLALDVSSQAVKRLIRAFLQTCGRPSHEADRLWRDEARFAGPHELGMCLRWGLARVVRIVGGHEVRGLLSYEHYAQWRDAEAALNYPDTHFSTFLGPLPPIVRSLLIGLLTLLTRFSAHSSSSGHTPPTLSPLFGPLLFGLGPSTLAFHHVYMHYLRATTATEHLILAFIRWQDAPSRAGSSATTLGVPMRLKAWIQGYPSTLPLTNSNERPQPRRGARTIRMISVRRNVRMYSPDLVKSCASWAHRPYGATSSTRERSFAGSKEWERIAPPTLKLPPRYSDAYRKRMDFPPNFHPEVTPGSTSSSLSNAPSLTNSVSTASTTSSVFDEKEFGVNKPGEDRFRSLTDLKWGEFEAMGFSGIGTDEKKLQFDLTESARAARAAKRATLTWQDFSTTGFSRTDAPLNATLQFSAPVANTINQWPSQSAEIHKKLKKTQKSLPPFGWDTEPILGSEEVIEEAFVDVFCDLIYGGGWMDMERREDLDRDCNWALVEFKSLPITRTTTSGTADPRTSSTLILFEEFVPLEYRQQLAESGTARRRLPSIFSTSKKQWKPATTLNGRPYVVGHVPHSPSYRELEFEGLLRSNGSKVLSLYTPDKQANNNTINPPPRVNFPSSVSPPPTVKPSLFLSPTATAPETPRRSSSRNSDYESSPAPMSPSPSQNPHRRSRFRLPVSPGGNRTAGLPPAEYENVDFEARLASFDGEELVPAGKPKHLRKHSRDDAWVDILVANSSRRMANQDAELRNGLKGGRSDPELASQEVSEVLASLKQMPSDDEDEPEPVPHDELEYDDDSRFGHDDRTETDRDTIPGTQETHGDAYADDEDEEDEPVIPVQKRRLGYFDLHPDRRPSGGSLLQDYTRSASPNSKAAAAAAATNAGAGEPFDNARTHFERHSVMEDPRDVFQRDSMDSQEDRTQEDAYDAIEEVKAAPVPPLKTRQNLPPIQPQANPLEAMRRATEDIRATAPSRIVPLPKDDPPVPPKPVQSKTSSLIEMYRERERAATSPLPAVPVVPPSRLPVRTTASLSPPAQERSTKTPSPTRLKEEFDDEPLPEPIRPEQNTGIVTPPRYVHGAPLHNVIEEPEEEIEE